MPIIVTALMYSGLPNPSWELTPDQAKQLQDIMNVSRERTLKQSASSLGLLGYRGLEVTAVTDTNIPSRLLCFDGIVEVLDSNYHNLIDSNSEVEEFLISTANNSLTYDEKNYIMGEIQKNVKSGVADNFEPVGLFAVPPYNPGKWNNDPTILRNNNCYNYANDLITNTFAQPGRGSGQQGPYPPNCPDTGAAAQRDGQIVVTSASSTPTQGHFIALVVSTTPGFFDYHWYRLDDSGMWSHKPGGTPVRNTDNSGSLISDPKTCNRGPYNLFCGYYHCIPLQVRIR